MDGSHELPESSLWTVAEKKGIDSKQEQLCIWEQWLRPVNPGTWEAEAEKSQIQGCPAWAS